MAAFHPLYDQAYTTTYSTNTAGYSAVTQHVVQAWTDNAFKASPRLRLPPPPSRIGRILSTPTPRAATTLRVEAVRRGRTEARPSRALRERRRVRSRA